MNKNKKKGSILLLALIYGTLLSLLLASVLNYSFNEYKASRRSLDLDSAFHLAEAGIERALYALQSNELNQVLNGTWQREGLNDWTLKINDLPIGTRNGDIQIFVTKVSDDGYEVVALGEIDYSVGSVQKAIKVEVDLTEDPGSSSSTNYIPDFVFKETLTLGHSTAGQTIVTSWDSSICEASKLLEKNGLQPNNTGGITGYDAVLASLSESSNAITVNNAWIYGKIGLNTDSSPLYDSKKRNKDQARLIGPDTHPGTNWDVGRIIHDFEVELPLPEKPDSTTYDRTEVYADQNYWSNNSATLGELNKTTYATAKYSFNLNNTELLIQGDVFLYVEGAVNANGTTKITMNGEDSSLTIMSKGSMNFSELEVNSRYPKQFLILQPENKGDIVIHTKFLPAFINAPDSNIRLHGTHQSVGNLKNYYFGGIVGKTLDHTNAFTLVSDSSMREQSSTTEQGSQTHIAVVKSWSEIPAASI